MEVVTTGAAPPTFWTCPIIILDSLTKPYILVQRERTEQTNFLLLYSKENGNWIADTFESNQSHLYTTSIDMVIDPQNRIWCVYTISNPYALIVAHKNSFAWEKDTLDTFPSSWASIISDSNAILHIAYQAGSLIYASLRGSMWEKETVDSEIYTESGCAINLDLLGQPQISYFRYGSIMGDKLWYAHKIDNQWHFEEIDNPDVPNWDPTSIRLNVDNQPCIVYCPTGRLRYAYKDTVWHIELVSSSGGQIATHKSLVIDFLNRPYILYYYGGNTILAHKESISWHEEMLPLTATTTRGYGGSLQIDREGVFHIARFATNNDGTYYEVHYIYGTPEEIEEGWKDEIPKIKGLKLGIYPNIVTHNTKLEFTIPEEQHINLALYDVLGRKVKLFINGNFEQGCYRLTWDGTDDSGRKLSEGVYFIRLDNQTEAFTQKVVILK